MSGRHSRFRPARRPRRHRGLKVLACLLAFGAGSALIAALAFWTVTATSGAGAYALAQAATLSPPTGPGAVANVSGTVTVSWTNAGTQLTGAQYTVRRTAPSAATICTQTAGPCTDNSAVPGVSNSYQIFAVLPGTNWQSGAVSASVTTPTPTLSIVLSASSATAGTPLTIVSVTAKNGTNTETTYNGTKTITWSGLVNSPSGQPPVYPTSTVTVVNGVATPGTSVTGFKAGSNTLTATDASNAGITGNVMFTLNPAAAAQLAFTTQPPATATAGATLPSFAVSIEDSFGNIATSDNTHTITIASTPTGVSCTAGTVTVASGTATFTTCSFATPNTYTLNATTSAGGVTPATSTQIVVSVGTANKLAFTTEPPANATTGVVLTSFAVAVKDSAGNVVTSSSAPVTIASSPAGISCTSNPVNASSGVATFSTCSINTAGTFTLTATSPGLTSAMSTNISVVSGVATHLVLSAATTTPVAGASDNLTITAEDASNNVVTSYTGSKSLTFSGAPAGPSGVSPTVTNVSGTAINFGSPTSIAFTNGVATVSGSANGVMKLFKAGAATITVSDGSISNGAGLSVTVSAGLFSAYTFTSIVVTGTGTSFSCPTPESCSVTLVHNTTDSFSAAVTAIDAWGNTTVVGATSMVAVTNATTNKGTVTGSPVTINSGSPTSTGRFTYAIMASGAYTDIVTATTGGTTGSLAVNAP